MIKKILHIIFLLCFFTNHSFALSPLSLTDKQTYPEIYDLKPLNNESKTSLVFKLLNFFYQDIFPEQVFLMIKNLCPFNCKDCIAKTNNREDGLDHMPKAEIEKIIENFKGIKKLYLLGPKETMAYGKENNEELKKLEVHPDFIEIVNKAAETVKEELWIVTNGFYIPRDYETAKTFFKKFNKTVHWLISLDEQHDKMFKTLTNDSYSLIHLKNNLMKLYEENIIPSPMFSYVAQPEIDLNQSFLYPTPSFNNDFLKKFGFEGITNNNNQHSNFVYSSFIDNINNIDREYMHGKYLGFANGILLFIKLNGDIVRSIVPAFRDDLNSLHLGRNFIHTDIYLGNIHNKNSPLSKTITDFISKTISKKHKAALTFQEFSNFYYKYYNFFYDKPLKTLIETVWIYILGHQEKAIEHFEKNITEEKDIKSILHFLALTNSKYYDKYQTHNQIIIKMIRRYNLKYSIFDEYINELIEENSSKYYEQKAFNLLKSNFKLNLEWIAKIEKLETAS